MGLLLLTTMEQLPSATPSDNFGSSFDEFPKNFKTENKILSEDNITLIKSYVERGNILKVISIIRDAMKDIENAPLSIAVIGEIGVGKSSFTNALMGFGPEEKCAAKTGPAETTKERAPYKSLKFRNVTLWDLPGIGSTDFQSVQKYLKKMKFEEYDFFIIISVARFKETDAQLTKAIGEIRKTFYVVRTKVDSDLQNEKISKPNIFNKETILQKIRENYKENLHKAKVKAPQIFLVSNIDVSNYDFPQLKTTLLHELPTHKYHKLINFVSSFTEPIIDQKRDSLKQKVWQDAWALKFFTQPFMIFISDNDVKELEEILSHYRACFGLDDVSLTDMAKYFRVSVKELKAHIKSPSLLSVEDEDKPLRTKLLECIEKVCSNGGLLENALPFRRAYCLHIYFIDTVASDAKTLLRNVNLLVKKVPMSNNSGY
ncbi:interferon-gamma-inducible GTPase 10-like isoform X1 [Dasypus novemcinctus]|uniref:interferon-gamma-inducible GTPase 10-like isoform X1 n=2 Tax=Dasypus novemcinctus TaxID=9361 RepID=UPI000328A41C|nr:interferon-gamma-inducible GTPase 10-like isoform X1 [Dasypus novemcinctus]XP_012386668.1 interferon-gamma-inducible GTPase 10-like isoform X1 [Dasypus novemcinctus]XP_023439140.1 interferon-gamma-inducible GTPase 10-like isoform X1 [Dasypus novemcinctus]XP_058139855.1 interferon-gamma-inducible GTPase 10-like isoform X1 [Dasypus novemcinctus]